MIFKLAKLNELGKFVDLPRLGFVWDRVIEPGVKKYTQICIQCFDEFFLSILSAIELYLLLDTVTCRNPSSTMNRFFCVFTKTLI